MADIDWDARRRLVESIDWDKLRAANEARRKRIPVTERLANIIREKPQLEYCADEVKDLTDAYIYILQLEESNARAFNKIDELRSDLDEARAMLKATRGVVFRDCPGCDGRRWVLKHGKRHTCERCDGTGSNDG